MSDDGADKDLREGAEPPNTGKGVARKRNRLTGATRRALEDLCFSLWEASKDASVRDALVRWKARNL